jgi:hypothetical protein
MIIEEHIISYSSRFLKDPASGFGRCFNTMRHPEKEQGRALLLYLHQLLSSFDEPADGEVNFEHVHLEGVGDTQAQLIAEFLVLRSFFQGLRMEKGRAANETMTERIRRLEQSIGKEIRDTGNLKGTSAAFRKLIAARNAMKEKRKFLERIRNERPEAMLSPRTLFNVLDRDQKRLSKSPGDQPYVMTVDQLSRGDVSYVMLNTSSFEALARLDHQGERLLRHIQEVFIFDAEGRAEFAKFNLPYLQQLNRTHQANFQSIRVISTSEGRLSFSRLKGLLERVRQRYHPPAQYPAYGAYIILAEEVKALTGWSSPTPMPVEFFGPTSLEVWNEVLDVVAQFEGTEELKSAKLLDLYALTIDPSLKELLLADLFNRDASWALSEDTRSSIGMLSSDDQAQLRNALALFLDWVISSDWPDKLRKEARHCDRLILPPLALNKREFAEGFHSALGLTTRQAMIDRSKLELSLTGRTLLLDYYDLGPMPETYNNNVLEILCGPERRMKGLFLNVLFGHRYARARYELGRHLVNILANPVRERCFDWAELRQKVKAQRPSDNVSYFELDDHYEQQQPQQTLTITIGGKKRIYPVSELFVIKDPEMPGPRVRRLFDLLADEGLTMPIQGQCLTDVYVDFNIYGRMADAGQQAEDLKVIMAHFDAPAGLQPMRLWKELLNRQVQSKGFDQVYLELQALLRAEGRQIVDRAHFVSTWATTESQTSLPRGRAIFRTICRYLDLPNSYLRIAVRRYNQEKLQRTRNSRQMNLLLRDLFNDGCFDAGANISAILQHNSVKYRRSHDLESIGLAPENALVELTALVELLLPEMNLSNITNLCLNRT